MYTLIESIDDLTYLNEELLQKEYIGVDTEFRRTSKDNMRLALLQVNDGDEIYLIDTLSISDPKEFASFLYSDSVTKIYHSCKEDLEAVFSWTNKEMINIFDTQLANSFLEDDYSISYQGLVEKKFGIQLEKNETRSNWIRRPLTEAQLKYATLDVEYLIDLYIHQKAQLIRTGKLEWLKEDILRLIDITFSSQIASGESSRIISKAKENDLLNDLNKIIERISKEQAINSTLFFSKKSQREFLRLVFDKGFQFASSRITKWRLNLLEDDLIELLKL